MKIISLHLAYVIWIISIFVAKSIYNCFELNVYYMFTILSQTVMRVMVGMFYKIVYVRVCVCVCVYLSICTQNT